jgi:hypothetical protein
MEVAPSLLPDLDIPEIGRHRGASPKPIRKAGTDMSDSVLHPTGDEAALALTEREVVEVPLLLPGWQVAALANAARDRGLTAGEMLRHALGDFIHRLENRQSPRPR